MAEEQVMCRNFGNVGSGSTRRERRRTVVSVTPPRSKPERTEPPPEWVVVDFERRGFKCERCGASERHSTPNGVSRLDSFALRGQAFGIDHAKCEPK